MRRRRPLYLRDRRIAAHHEAAHFWVALTHTPAAYAEIDVCRFFGRGNLYQQCCCNVSGAVGMSHPTDLILRLSPGLIYKARYWTGHYLRQPLSKRATASIVRDLLRYGVVATQAYLDQARELEPAECRFSDEKEPNV
jgi:hypothetical protein